MGQGSIGRRTGADRQRGTVTVETALLLPALLLLFLGLIDLGRLMWWNGVALDAAAAGARLAVLHEPGDDDVRQAVAQYLAREGVDATPTITVSNRQPDMLARVEVSVPFEFFVLPGLVQELAGSRQVTAVSEMLYER